MQGQRVWARHLALAVLVRWSVARATVQVLQHLLHRAVGQERPAYALPSPGHRPLIRSVTVPNDSTK